MYYKNHYKTIKVMPKLKVRKSAKNLFSFQKKKYKHFEKRKKMLKKEKKRKMLFPYFCQTVKIYENIKKNENFERKKMFAEKINKMLFP